jgi:hypothetical protein
MEKVTLSTEDYIDLFHAIPSVQLTQIRSFAKDHKDVTHEMNVEHITDRVYNSSAHIYWEFRNSVPEGRYGLLIEQRLKNGQTGQITALDTQMIEKIFSHILNKKKGE